MTKCVHGRTCTMHTLALAQVVPPHTPQVKGKGLMNTFFVNPASSLGSSSCGQETLPPCCKDAGLSLDATSMGATSAASLSYVTSASMHSMQGLTLGARWPWSAPPNSVTHASAAAAVLSATYSTVPAPTPRQHKHALKRGDSWHEGWGGGVAGQGAGRVVGGHSAMGSCVPDALRPATLASECCQLPVGEVVSPIVAELGVMAGEASDGRVFPAMMPGGREQEQAGSPDTPAESKPQPPASTAPRTTAISSTPSIT